jgi:hypothetical protein
MHRGFLWESQKEKDHYEDLDVDDRIRLKWIIEMNDGKEWTEFILLGIQTRVAFLLRRK